MKKRVRIVCGLVLGVVAIGFVFAIIMLLINGAVNPVILAGVGVFGIGGVAVLGFTV